MSERMAVPRDYYRRLNAFQPTLDVEMLVPEMISRELLILTATLKKKISLGSMLTLFKKPYLLFRLPRFFWQLRNYRVLEQNQNGKLSSLRLYPCLSDVQPSQPVRNFYFYQDCWAAKQVFQEVPPFVVDVGSTVLLVGILSQFKACISVDIRPVEARLDGLESRTGSVLALPFDDDEVPCLTTMCVLEHIGLGRYGDTLDPDGTVKAVKEIKRVIKPGGIVVFSVPVGQELTEFNANRRFTYKQAKAFFEGWDLVDTCILSPFPQSIASEEELIEMRDPIACFCLRKPVQ
jgi:hypothetical protein